MSGVRINVKVSLGGAKKALSAAHERAKKPKLLMKWAVGNVAKAFRENFLKLNEPPRSKYGHNFYRREGEEKTTAEVGSDGQTGAVVVASPQMAHKLKGGVVRAKRGKALAIPVSEWAKRQQRNPRAVPGLDLFLLNGRAYLGARGDGGRLDVHYLLVRSVTHKPHPEVIPGESVLTAAVAKACRQYERFA